MAYDTTGALTWTDERIAICKQMWTDGKSLSEIGQVLHITRNAVCGKLNRLGFRHRTFTPEIAAERRAKLRAHRKSFCAPWSDRNRATKPAKPKHVRHTPPEPLHVPLLSRTQAQCAAIASVLEFGRATVCGRPVAVGSWCEGCARVVYRGRGGGA